MVVQIQIQMSSNCFVCYGMDIREGLQNVIDEIKKWTLMGMKWVVLKY